MGGSDVDRGWLALRRLPAARQVSSAILFIRLLRHTTLESLAGVLYVRQGLKHEYSGTEVAGRRL